ncbi:MAG: response regulator transcription factor [Candidatus Limivicinus sp.]|nr:response regulator transcription factor [Clostridiales bacterium]MCI7137727.1 response regulator transcription factor [Clostridiales bacterium]MDY6132651.1 response regulator transcription factor [Candidatus Limivicinus sp.]
MRILVVEDEKRLNRIISEALEDEGYSVDSCFNGLDALDYAAGADYDVIILDIMMPRMDGLEVVRRLRSGGNSTPVLFLTARDSVADRVTGLESGGDYYLVKPFDFQELMAVVRVMTRKYTGNRSNVYTIADLRLDATAKTVTRAGKNIELTAKEFALLEYMLRNKGVVLSREMIENNLWNYDYEGGTNVVDVYVGYLRKKMDTGFDRKLIHTVWGTGWVLKEG